MKAGKALHTKRYGVFHLSIGKMWLFELALHSLEYWLQKPPQKCISAEIRVQFRHVPGNLYKRNFGTDLDKATNELVLRVQPDEAIYLKINNKVPGLGMRLDRSDLNLLYRSRY
jgi:hypothetical protein